MAEQKRDRAHSDGELDYDSLLSRYKDAAEPEPEPPPPPREKKKIISTLLSDVSAPGEGKFARKRGQKAAPQQKEPEEEPQAPPLKLEELKGKSAGTGSFGNRCGRNRQLGRSRS